MYNFLQKITQEEFIAIHIFITMLSLALYTFNTFVLKTKTFKRMKVKELMLYSLPYFNMVLFFIGIISLYTNFDRAINMFSRPIITIKKKNQKKKQQYKY